MNAPEFSRLVTLEEAGRRPERCIEANEAERAALAKRFSLLSLEALSADFTLAPVPSGVRITGRIAARAVQACAISAAEVPARIDEAVEVLFFLRTGPAGVEEEVELDAAALDVLPLPPGGVDLGELAAETLGLALDPYPRADADTLSRARRHLISEEEAAAPVRRDNPFSVLKRPKPN